MYINLSVQHNLMSQPMNTTPWPTQFWLIKHFSCFLKKLLASIPHCLETSSCTSICSPTCRCWSARHAGIAADDLQCVRLRVTGSQSPTSTPHCLAGTVTWLLLMGRGTYKVGEYSACSINTVRKAGTARLTNLGLVNTKKSLRLLLVESSAQEQ